MICKEFLEGWTLGPDTPQSAAAAAAAIGVTAAAECQGSSPEAPQ